ncbi:MAG: ATP-binding cassette domain-containing protein [Rubrivivax sp.]
MAPLLTLAGASVHFGAVTALREVDLELRRGERLALVGANGSGKTTLLRLLHGFLPHEGRRTLHGAAPSVVMVFQRPFLLRLTVRANLRLALWLRGVRGAERAARADEALARVGLTDLAARAATTLSGGQQQRLALARAWALAPDLLLLDEPTASLDPGAKREVEALIERIAGDGVTVVMSTHNLGQAKRLARRVAYLDCGRLRVDLPVERFFNDPLPAAAAHFLKGELPWL